MQADTATPALLDALLETDLESTQILAPTTGRRVSLRAGAGGEDTLEVRSPDGAVELAIRLTAAGPVLSVSAVGLELTAQDKLSVRCRELELEATEDATLRAGGDITLQAQGEMDLHARGDCRVVANILFLN